MSRRKRRSLSSCLALVAMLVLCVSPTTGNTMREARVKAAFVYNFARYAVWPDTSFETTDSPLLIGVVGNDPMRGALVEILEEKPIAGRPGLVVLDPPLEQLRRCHFVYVSESERDRLSSILETVRSDPVLTVSDIRDFGLSGGIITMVRKDDRFRMQINRGAADEAGLQLSSRLLQLSEFVASGR